MDKTSLCLLNAKYGNWVFKSHEAFIRFQESCKHDHIIKIAGKAHDYEICERCLRITSEVMSEHHPDVSRWHNEGGPPVIEVKELNRGGPSVKEAKELNEEDPLIIEIKELTVE